MATQQRTFVDKRKGDTLINVLIGAALAFVISTFAPLLSQVAGGAVSGYLQQEGRMPGAKVGAMAAVVSTIPGLLVALVVMLLFFPFMLAPILQGELAAGLVGILILLAIVIGVLLVSAAFTAVLGGLGGYVGAMLFEN